MIEIVKVTQLRPLPGHRLWVRFSDGREGIRDFADIIAESGSMVEPLRDENFFRKAFVSFGVPTWPNGYDIDAIALHQEMEERGLLSPKGAVA